MGLKCLSREKWEVRERNGWTTTKQHPTANPPSALLTV